MSIEEAIEILKEQSRCWNPMAIEEWSDAMDMAISALRAQQTTAKLDRRRLEGCEWCIGFSPEVTGDPHWDYRFCPKCGRPLTEGAWVESEEITTEPYGCVFYCNRKCNLDGDFCAEGPGCPYEVNAVTAKHLLELAQAEKDGRLVVLPVKPYLTPTQQNEMYICENGEVWAIYVTGCEAGPNSDGVFTVLYNTVDGYGFSTDDIGKTVFLNREEAEAALEKRKERPI